MKNHTKPEYHLEKESGKEIHQALIRNLEKCASLTTSLFAMKTSLYKYLYPNSDTDEIRSIIIRDILRRKAAE